MIYPNNINPEISIKNPKIMSKGFVDFVIAVFYIMVCVADW